MKQTDLIKVMKKYLNTEIRKIVREEIKFIVDNNMRDVIREEIELGSLKGTIIEETEEYTAELRTPPVKEESYESLVPKKFSTNPMLNNILAETAKEAFSNKTGIEDEYKQMGTTRTSDSVHQTMEPAVAATAAGSNQPITDIREILPDDRKHRDIPEFLQNVLTRDYSELTKAMSIPKKPGIPDPKTLGK